MADMAGSGDIIAALGDGDIIAELGDGATLGAPAAPGTWLAGAPGPALPLHAANTMAAVAVSMMGRSLTGGSS